MLQRIVIVCLISAVFLTSPASAGSLTGWSHHTPAIVDLTAEGTLDWAVWTNGAGGISTIRKASGGDKISALNCTGYDAGSVHTAKGCVWTWSDGSPQATAPASFATGVSHSGGSSFTVPADQTVRTVRVYVSSYNTVGVLTAHLSDGSAVDYVDGSWVPDRGDNFEAVYTLVYSANSPNQTLKISWDPQWAGEWGMMHTHAASLQAGAATQPAGTLPAPTGLRAIPGDGMVSFAWPRVTGAHSYNLYLSTTPGSTPSTPAATGIIAATSFFRPGDSWLLGDYGHRGLTNGVTYTFQLTAVTGNVESPKSAMVTATPSAGGAISRKRLIKIMPMGNSICGGWPTTNGGWRRHLCDSLKKDGYLFRFVGSQTWPYKHPDTGFGQPWHEGYGGRQVMAISEDIIRQAVSSYDPDITLLEIGTNDFAWINPTQENVQNALKNYDSLLARFYRTNPDGWLLAAPILPLGTAKAAYVNSFNAGIKSRMEALAQSGKHAVYVKEMENITYAQLGDGVHPKPETYPIIAGVWLHAIRAITDDSGTETPPRTFSRAAAFMPRVAVYAGSMVISAPGIAGVRVWTPAGTLVRTVTAEANASMSTIAVPTVRGIYVVDIIGYGGNRHRSIVAGR